ncbi:MAG: ComEC/Rec2 family competence protein [Pseudomonadota bacterium]
MSEKPTKADQSSESGLVPETNGPFEQFWLPVSGETGSLDNRHIVREPDETERPEPVHPSIQLDLEAGRLQRMLWRADLHLHPVWQKILAAFRYEAEHGAGFLLAPVVFGMGVLVYYFLPREPLVAAFPLAAVTGWLMVWKLAPGTLSRGPAICSALLLSGATVAQMHALRTDTGMLSRTHFTDVAGQVERLERRADGSVRYTLQLRHALLPKRAANELRAVNRVRLTARKGGPAVAVGQTLSGKARVGPPSGPAHPGAYDFSFANWFDGIGGIGFFLGAPKLVPESRPPELTWGMRISAMRSDIAALIRDALPGRYGGLAAALIVGDRSGIDDDTAENLRRSGLAHILAISGLHMALVSATVITIMRFGFALSPSLALHYPVRKWASLAGLFAASIYLLMSGANVSTQRAYLMVSILLIAVMIDRRALTMRNVAIAAAVVLIVAPHTVLSPGFQMSFAAVAALIACYESISRYRARRFATRDRSSGSSRGQGLMVYAARNIGGLALTSLIAGAATGLFAAYHFQRVAPYGLLANLLAMPLVSIAVMPLALISVIAMPFGLESYPLAAMTWALQPVASVADWVSGLEPAGNTGMLSPTGLVFGTLALLAITLLRGSLKWLGAPLVVLATIALPQTEKPDILIAENGRQIGIIGEGDVLSLMRPNAEKFTTEIWMKAYAPHQLLDTRAQKAAKSAGQFACDDFGCTAKIRGLTVTGLKSTAQIHRDCRNAHILIIPFETKNACAMVPENQRPRIIDAAALRRFGSQAIFIEQSSVLSDWNGQTPPAHRVSTSYSGKIRPWTRQRANRESEAVPNINGKSE